jgi:hypothetical protein
MKIINKKTKLKIKEGRKKGNSVKGKEQKIKKLKMGKKNWE